MGRRASGSLLAVVTFSLLAGPLAAAGPKSASAAPAVDPATDDDAALKGRCRNLRGLGVLVSPQQPVAGERLRVLVVSERPRPGARLLGRGPDRNKHALEVLSRGGPPYWWYAEIKKPALGRHRFMLVDSAGKSLACSRPRVQRRVSVPQDTPLWPIRRGWRRTAENFYSAWIEKLFDAPPGERPGWTPLHKALRDPDRNLLINYLGTKEDGPGRKYQMRVEPDCADLPYFLRAYFAWKMRLPFGYRHCDRGSSRRPTKCRYLRTGLTDDRSEVTGRKDVGVATRPGDTVGRRFTRFLRRKLSMVHSGSGRTAPDDDESDLYPLKLRRDAVRPGAVYVDPYGHLLVVSRWVPQTAKTSGLLYAVDGHPDLSVGRKRFWRGAFLFSDNVRAGAGGFKWFRPLVFKGEDGKSAKVVPLTNEEITKSGNYGDLSDEQYKLGIDGFYDRMDELINPRPLSPLQAMRERLKALYELVQERIDSVKAGEDYMKKTAYAVVPMPIGPRIFETRGPWEDFSTPARDMRLLIAMQDVLDYPKKVVKFPKRFALTPGQAPAAAKEAMQALIKTFTAEKSVTYQRSDGRDQVITMAQILSRRKAMEVGYNPNDCVEIRWGSDPAEMTTCKRRAPTDQQTIMMKRYRPWFATRTRPPIR